MSTMAVPSTLSSLHTYHFQLFLLPPLVAVQRTNTCCSPSGPESDFGGSRLLKGLDAEVPEKPKGHIRIQLNKGDSQNLTFRTGGTEDFFTQTL
ncbi:hypothetical protein E2C01_066730 [Portunus trituberculatus]|uniref:Uncharacterized protein n=1 Tax=Portunus trituberculatus TaxID=210409 RepID=A0A5B7HRR8_PORTR|nr:hypothetical protein [Portunus trituberculatus]